MTEKVQLIDPSANTAKELFEYLSTESLFNPNGNSASSEFYVSVPNKDNKSSQINKEGSFLYDYKYGRIAGENKMYVQYVPFDTNNISEASYTRFKMVLPKSYAEIVKSKLK